MIRFNYQEMYPNDEKVESLINRAKSDSGLHGSELRMVHYMIGRRLGYELVKNVDIEDVVLMPLLTGAIPLAFGVGEVIDTKMIMVDLHHDMELPEVKEETIILIDEVINSGQGILKIADHYSNEHRIILVTSAMPENSEALNSPYDIYTFRVSKHRYIGAMVSERKGNKGPDTAARLYSLL